MTQSIHLHRETVLTNKLAIIDVFTKEANLSRDLRIRLRHALKYSTEKTGFSWADKHNIFTELPRQLKYEVALAMHQGAIKHIGFFKDKDPVFISCIVPFLQHLFVNAYDYIYKEKEYADEIYFIARGRVSYVFGMNKVIYKTLQKGAYFGDIEVLEITPRKSTIQALVDCDLLTMHRSVNIM